ncbi:adenine phosphoribosyltransferase [Corynebacterium mendelii]|uniref:Adenine phosphoribosyltransferase n=1 Tax=Corynebacterium mendelii TaxID=2765362 RepID=A0A939E0S4_9CORY|nr:adenine phosphoribosyltransferase [Corynebacterium mendelii]MBN9643382.1 adenine phosphoribosyltransferase [Corynebacterium mendelii]
MAYADARQALKDKTRLVPDFPEKGVLFEDLTPVLADAEAFALVIDELAAAAKAYGAEMIGGLDARGFLLGSAVAYKLGLGVLAIRKQGKLPPPVYNESYALEYGTAALEVPKNADMGLKGKNIVLIDDVLATGGTLAAARNLLEQHCGAHVSGLAVVLEVEGLGGREKTTGLPLTVIGTDPAPVTGHGARPGLAQDR